MDRYTPLAPSPSSSAPEAIVEDRPMACALAGWPPGSVYIPRTPILHPGRFAMEEDSCVVYTKQHRGRRRPDPEQP